jgi:antitoxin (DNA-binding transcriptional repressor) of toxin-antitoxin stability system
MKKMSVSQFKAECLSLFDNLDPEGLDITKHGKVVARVTPVEQQSASLIGSMKGKIKKKDNLFSTGVKWNAES